MSPTWGRARADMSPGRHGEAWPGRRILHDRGQTIRRTFPESMSTAPRIGLAVPRVLFLAVAARIDEPFSMHIYGADDKDPLGRTARPLSAFDKPSSIC
ncbi:hypothetical protein [Oerskovia paurometabola]|uniref:hypothetical protein n=1 Tax=Oerskovia paurometabola TaxID=162170 RepID=UPI0037F43418